MEYQMRTTQTGGLDATIERGPRPPTLHYRGSPTFPEYGALVLFEEILRTAFSKIEKRRLFRFAEEFNKYTVLLNCHKSSK